jgi:hypothetical protein
LQRRFDMTKIGMFYRKMPVRSSIFRGFSFAALFFAFVLLFFGCSLVEELGLGEDSPEEPAPVLSIEGDAFDTPPGGTLTFTVKRDGDVVIPDEKEVGVSGAYGVRPGTDIISINPETGGLTLKVDLDEAVGYRVLKITAACDGKTADISVTVHTPSEYFTVAMVDGIVTITGYSGPAGVVVIPAAITINGAPFPVTAIGQGAFQGNQLTSVTIPDSVETIKRGAFYSNPLLTSVTIGGGVTINHDESFPKGSSNHKITLMRAYNNAGKAAGTYTYDADDWSKQEAAPQ